MGDFLAALSDQTVPFIRYAFIAGLLSSISFGIIGSFVIVKRISYIAGAISHAALAGIGASLFLQVKYNVSWISPIGGAIITSVLSAIIISLVHLYSKEREDTIIGTIWAFGMGIGLLFISKTPGYIDPMSYLFGNILLISKTDLILISILDVTVITLGIIFYDQFLALCFDEEFAKTRGLNTTIFQIFLIILVSLTVVLMVTTVGIVMVIALLTIPAAIAGMFSKKLWQMMILAAIICAFFTSTGLFISYSANLPGGTSTIVFAGAVYFIILILKQFKRSKQNPKKQKSF